MKKLNDQMEKIEKTTSGGIDDALDKVSDNIDKINDSIGDLGKAKGFDKFEKKANAGQKALEKLKNIVKDVGTSIKDTGTKLKTAATKLKEFGKIGLDKLKNSLKTVNTHLGNIAKKAAGATFTGLKRLASISFKGLVTGLVAGSAAIVKFANMASDLEETKNKVDVAFGSGKGAFDGASKDVMEWSKNSTTAMGLAQQTALDTAALFGDMGTSMGLTKQAAADMSMSLTQQAADLASFKNMGIDEVTTALNGVFTGETESLKRLGVVMTQANLEQYALKQGIKKSLDEMTEAEKVQLRYNYVMEKTANATGDYARTGGGFANQLRTLTENFKQLGAIIGQLPMKTLANGMKVVNDALAEIQGILSDGFQEGDGDKIMKIIENLIDKGVTALETGLPKIMPKVVSFLNTLIDAVVRILPKVAPSLASGVAQLMVGFAKAIIDNKEEIFDAIKQIIVEVSKALYEGFTGKEMSGDMFAGLKEKAEKVIPVLKKLAPAVIGVVAAFKGFQALSALTSLFGGKGGGGGKGGFMKTFKELAKTKPAVILKGIGNLAIILGGVTILSAALMAVAPHIAKLSDLKSIAKLLIVILAVGAVGTALSKMAGAVGKIPVSTVAKGLANIAIIVAGMSALYLLIGAVSLIDFDLKRILKISVVIGALGVVGTALAVFAGIAGIIPVATVALGLANIAIIVAGMSALYLLIGAVSLIDFDIDRILQITVILGALGTVGSALTVFAGLIGMIPIPVVLLGLANMALVLGGLTAIVVAFGAMCQIDGFSEFLTQGGQILVQLFDIIGQCAGALVGGLAEGLSDALPALGENIGKFGENIKPLFNVIKTVDIGSVASFFGAIVALLGIATGNEVVEGIKAFFFGEEESALAKLGTQLSDFALNSKTFFDTVKNFSADGFTNATKLFDCLAGMKTLPKDGGVTSWFTGSVDYTSLANGLIKLADENVIKFFTAVAELKQGGFDNATKLFDCLAGMKSLPSDGGIKGWFSGSINYESIASGLAAFAGEGVKNFFTMVSGFGENTFNNTKLLFDTLAGIKSLPKEGGFWQNLGDAITGKETKSSLSVIADDLSNFGEKTKDFFTDVNQLNVSNLNGLWDSLKKADSISSDVSKTVDDNIKDIVKKISELPNKMGDGIKKSGKSLKEALVSIWKDAVTATVSPVNKLLSGANWIYKQFGSDKTVEKWKPYAKGTDGHKGGNALVNDGRGAELVQMPNGKTFIPNGRNVFLPNAPRGMKVLSAERTAALFGKKSPTFRYADGVGDIDVWSYADNAKGLIGAVRKAFVDYEGMGGLAKSIASRMVNTIANEMPKWADKLYDEVGTLASYVPSKGVEQWRSTVARALKMEGQYSASNVSRTLFQMKTESGGNPRAINLWDSNAKKGIPSKGLMQVIDPTFNAYARDGYDKNIYDPLSNILASVRYATSRYGSLAKAYRGVGYSNGVGTVDLPKQSLQLSYTPKSRFTDRRSSVTEYNTYSPQFNLTVSGASDERTMAQKVKRWVADAMNETFESMERKSERLQEV